MLDSYLQETVIGTDVNFASADSTRLLGVFRDGTFLWRNDQILPASTQPDGRLVRATRGLILYLFGRDLLDGKNKLFLVHSRTGAIVRSIETDPMCFACGVAVADDGTMYVTGQESNKIFKVPAQINATSQVAVDLFNVDDLECVTLNGQLVAEVGYQQTGHIDLSSRLVSGVNVLEIEVVNTSPNSIWTYGYRITTDGTAQVNSACGQVGAVGCQKSDLTLGIVYRQTYLIFKN